MSQASVTTCCFLKKAHSQACSGQDHLPVILIRPPRPSQSPGDVFTSDILHSLSVGLSVFSQVCISSPSSNHPVEAAEELLCASLALSSALDLFLLLGPSLTNTLEGPRERI